MQRWFRFSGTIALISLLTSGFPGLSPSLQAQENAAPEAEEEVVLKGFDADDLPPPGKHQLKPTPLQIANHRIMRLAERIAAQSERVIALEKTVAAQKEQLARQNEELEARTKKVAEVETRLQAMFEQIATVSKQVERVEATQATQATQVAAARDTQRTAPATPAARLAQEPSVQLTSESIPSALPVHPDEPDVPRQAPKEEEPAVEAPPAGSIVYTIKKGDNLTVIARAHGTTVAEIMKINRIADERKLQIGQQLFIPPGATPAPTAEPSPQSSPAASEQP